MYFEPHALYHVYNQGNNRQQTFFQEENYLFFLKKMRIFLLPHTDLLAYCLMPNHFHWLLYTKESACELLDFSKNTTQALPKRQRLSHQINTLLSSYTRAINIQEKRSGSLFRAHTKAKNGWVNEFEEAAKRRLGTDGFTFGVGNDYALQCFHYIHDNPPRAGLVAQSTDWRYSSALEYAGLRNGTLCNQALARELLGLA